MRPWARAVTAFVSWDAAGGYIVLERNENYYGKVPNIRRVIYKTVAVESTKALMLQSGEADVAWLNARYADRFRGRGRLPQRGLPDGELSFLLHGFSFRLLAAQRRFHRRAELRVDKPAIVKSVLAGHGSPAYSPIQKNRFGGNPAARHVSL